MIFEVEVLSGRDISKLSIFPKEEEILLLPYSHFEVIDVIDTPNEPAIIKLREVQVPRGSKVTFWVDDNPQNNFKEIRVLEKEGVSIVCCQSTEEAFKLLDTYKWLLYLNNADFRVVTDMVRVENGQYNYYAGLDLIKGLRKTYNYGHQVLIYCNDVAAAQKNCTDQVLTDKVYVAKERSKLKKFIQFQSIE